MAEVHLIVGIGVMATSLVAGVWGAYAWLRHRPSVIFWYQLRLSQACVVLQVLLGALLVVLGHEPESKLHYLYGLLPLAITLATESMRAGGAQRELGDRNVGVMTEAEQEQLALRIVRFEMGIMALGALVIFGLAVRAGMTSGHLF